MINLYKYHVDPKSLDHHDIKHTLSPELAWEYGKSTGQWYEKMLAKNVSIAYFYAVDIIKSRFISGESIIATDRFYKNKYNEKFGTRL